MDLIRVSAVITVCWLAICSRAARCPGALPSPPLTCAQRRGIVDKHNSLRQQVALGRVKGQSPAVDMTLMTWDKELAQLAQWWADRCVFQHTSKRNVARFTYGQNLGIWTYSKPISLNSVLDFQSIIQKWFDEVKYGYSYGFDRRTGHYSQIIWADTHLIGCGYSYYRDHRGYSILYVCNYGPSGNYEGQLAYKRGRASCTRRNLIPSKTFKGLCVVRGDNTNPCS